MRAVDKYESTSSSLIFHPLPALKVRQRLGSLRSRIAVLVVGRHFSFVLFCQRAEHYCRADKSIDGSFTPTPPHFPSLPPFRPPPSPFISSLLRRIPHNTPLFPRVRKFRDCEERVTTPAPASVDQRDRFSPLFLGYFVFDLKQLVSFVYLSRSQ